MGLVQKPLASAGSRRITSARAARDIESLRPPCLPNCLTLREWPRRLMPMLYPPSGLIASPCSGAMGELRFQRSASRNRRYMPLKFEDRSPRSNMHGSCARPPPPGLADRHGPKSPGAACVCGRDRGSRRRGQRPRPTGRALRRRLQRLIEVRENVVDVLDADRQPHVALGHAGRELFCRARAASGSSSPGGWRGCARRRCWRRDRRASARR